MPSQNMKTMRLDTAERLKRYNDIEYKRKREKQERDSRALKERRRVRELGRVPRQGSANQKASRKKKKKRRESWLMPSPGGGTSLNSLRKAADDDRGGWKAHEINRLLKACPREEKTVPNSTRSHMFSEPSWTPSARMMSARLARCYSAPRDGSGTSCKRGNRASATPVLATGDPFFKDNLNYDLFPERSSNPSSEHLPSPARTAGGGGGQVRAIQDWIRASETAAEHATAAVRFNQDPRRAREEGRFPAPPSAPVQNFLYDDYEPDSSDGYPNLDTERIRTDMNKALDEFTRNLHSMNLGPPSPSLTPSPSVGFLEQQKRALEQAISLEQAKRGGWNDREREDHERKVTIADVRNVRCESTRSAPGPSCTPRFFGATQRPTSSSLARLDSKDACMMKSINTFKPNLRGPVCGSCGLVNLAPDLGFCSGCGIKAGTDARGPLDVEGTDRACGRRSVSGWEAEENAVPCWAVTPGSSLAASTIGLPTSEMKSLPLHRSHKKSPTNGIQHDAKSAFSRTLTCTPLSAAAQAFVPRSPTTLRASAVEFTPRHLTPKANGKPLAPLVLDSISPNWENIDSKEQKTRYRIIDSKQAELLSYKQKEHKTEAGLQSAEELQQLYTLAALQAHVDGLENNGAHIRMRLARAFASKSQSPSEY